MFTTATVLTVALSLPHLAAVPPAQTCVDSIEQAVSGINDQGGIFLGIVDVPGAGFDQMLVFLAGGSIVVGLAERNCMVSDPIPLAPAAGPGV